MAACDAGGPPGGVDVIVCCAVPGGYEASLDVLGLSSLQKVTARLIDGLEIQQVGGRQAKRLFEESG
jgi:hypothetical protein